jgi:hypothetical protein
MLRARCSHGFTEITEGVCHPLHLAVIFANREIAPDEHVKLSLKAEGKSLSVA